MSGKLKILVTGVTGYVGGSVLTQLLNHPEYSKSDITVVVRSDEKAQKLKNLGINVSVGSHTDPKVIEHLAAETDVVIAAADASSFEAAQATLAGLKKRYETRGTPATYIQTSSIRFLGDGAVGIFKSDAIYDDLKPEQVLNLTATEPHHEVDLLLLKADIKGIIKLYIVYPAAIYGRPEGILIDQDIQNAHSIQVPMLIRAALSRGGAGMVGKGVNIWSNVHIQDVANLYILLLETTIKHPEKAAHGHDGIYFAENGEHTLFQAASAIGEALVAIGKTSNPEPTSFTQEEIERYLTGLLEYFGSNCRCRANRSRSLGWKPTKTATDFLASIKPEVETIASKGAKN